MAVTVDIKEKYWIYEHFFNLSFLVLEATLFPEHDLVAVAES